MSDLERRIEDLENDPAARFQRVRDGSLDISELTDAELDTFIAELDVSIGPEESARIRDMSAEELAALANGTDAAPDEASAEAAT